MSEFILLFRGEDAHTTGHSAETMQAHMYQWMQWMDGIQKQGKFIGAQPLMQTGKVLDANKKIILEGPFIEGKKMVAGYLLCKADNYDEAVAIAKNCPILEYEDGLVEIREIQEIKL